MRYRPRILVQPHVDLRSVSNLFQTPECGAWPRHRHNSAYAAIILEGGYFECGDMGRWKLEDGDIVFHRAFEAHANTVSNAKTRVINLVLPVTSALPAVFQIRHTDQLVRALASDRLEAQKLLVPSVTKQPLEGDWPDELARFLSTKNAPIREWCQQAGLAPSTVSRGFKSVYGTTPAKYRLEAQTRRAFQEVLSTNSGLADIAQRNGFSDQPHMTRAMTQLTGFSPGRWRDVNSVQDDCTCKL